MGQQIRFFEIPSSDYSNKNFSFTITDDLADSNGQDIADFMRNRNLTSSWLTTGSADANNTELLASFGGDAQDVDSLFLVKHNLKDYKIERFDGTAWQLVANITDNDQETTEHVVGESAKELKITIYATQTVDADKKITQFLTTRSIGQMTGYPEITMMSHTQGIKNSTMLSGKHSISNSVGATSFILGLKVMNEQADVDLVESLFYTYKRGVLVYVGGGNQEQFKVKARGYRLEDFYIVKPSKDYRDDFYKSLYGTGTKLSITLQEVV